MKCSDKKKQLWEILVPAKSNDGLEYSIEHHRDWDDKVREITGGLTILKTARGQWLDEKGDLYREKMIPVRIACTEPQIDSIIQYTLEHYEQKAVMAYLVAERVKIVKKTSQ